MGDGGVRDHPGGGQEWVRAGPGGGGEDAEGAGEGQEGTPHHHLLHLLRGTRSAKVSWGGGREGPGGGRERDYIAISCVFGWSWTFSVGGGGGNGGGSSGFVDEVWNDQS